MNNATLTTEQSNAIASEIIAQLGGANRLSAMIGARSFISDGASLRMKFAAKALQGINYLVIELTSLDLYDVSFQKVRGMNVNEITSISGVYATDLKRIIESKTGLRLSL